MYTSEENSAPTCMSNGEERVHEHLYLCVGVGAVSAFALLVHTD